MSTQNKWRPVRPKEPIDVGVDEVEIGGVLQRVSAHLRGKTPEDFPQWKFRTRRPLPESGGVKCVDCGREFPAAKLNARSRCPLCRAMEDDFGPKPQKCSYTARIAELEMEVAHWKLVADYNRGPLVKQQPCAICNHMFPESLLSEATCGQCRADVLRAENEALRKERDEAKLLLSGADSMCNQIAALVFQKDGDRDLLEAVENHLSILKGEISELHQDRDNLRDAVKELCEALRPFADAGEKYRAIWDAGDLVVLACVISGPLPEGEKRLSTWSFHQAQSALQKHDMPWSRSANTKSPCSDCRHPAPKKDATNAKASST